MKCFWRAILMCTKFSKRFVSSLQLISNRSVCICSRNFIVVCPLNLFVFSFFSSISHSHSLFICHQKFIYTWQRGCATAPINANWEKINCKRKTTVRKFGREKCHPLLYIHFVVALKTIEHIVSHCVCAANDRLPVRLKLVRWQK